MARARNIKPGFFKNEILGVADPLYSLLFEGLWVLADRAGRLEDRPLRIKGEVFPYRDGLDMDAMLNWLQENGFIQRTEVDGLRTINILNAKQWYSDASPETVAASGASRRARMRKAMPAWADKAEIRMVYAQARILTETTGIQHHVDHEIPLSSDKVCGLHVSANLKPIPFMENLKKSNQFGGLNG